MGNELMTMDSCRDTLIKMESQMRMALPNHITPEKIQRVIFTELQKNPAILKCTKTSILTSVMEACQLGLVPNSVQGLAYLIPYGNRCQLITGYKGLISLALQSGILASIWGRVVREDDKFEYEEGTDPYIKHVPVLAKDVGQNSSNIIGAYAVAKMKRDESTQFELLSLLDIERIKSKSARGGKGGPWKDDYEQMAKKSAVRQLLKWLPLESEKIEFAAGKREGASPGFEYNMDTQDFVYIGEDSSANDDLNKEFSNK